MSHQAIITFEQYDAAHVRPDFGLSALDGHGRLFRGMAERKSVRRLLLFYTLNERPSSAPDRYTVSPFELNLRSPIAVDRHLPYKQLPRFFIPVYCAA